MKEYMYIYVYVNKYVEKIDLLWIWQYDRNKVESFDKLNT